jgi:hypothetical protein
MEELIREEEQKMRRLKFIVDLTEAVLMQSDLTLQESWDLVDQTKKAALALFPDKESAYTLIYLPRFRRIIDERFTIPGSLSGKN